MAYCFLAEDGACDLETLHGELSVFGFEVIECFPISPASEYPALGVCIPMKSLDHPAFRSSVVEFMTHLIVAREFTVTDLYRGEPVHSSEIASLPDRIA